MIAPDRSAPTLAAQTNCTLTARTRMSAASVRQAKSRVLRRLRNEFHDLLE